MTLLSIGNFRFKGTRDRFGVGEYLTTLDGWDEGVRTRGKSQGPFDPPSFMEERTVRFTANMYAENREKLRHRGLAFTALLAGGHTLPVSIELDGQTLRGVAGAGKAAPTFKLVGGRLAMARASMELLFEDPRRFGEAEVFPNAHDSLSQISQRGDFVASPIITVKGSAALGYTLDLPGGKRYTVIVPLVAGTDHVINMADGYLRINGVIVSNAVGRADLCAIPGGVTVTISVTPVSGTASLSVLLLDTFS